MVMIAIWEVIMIRFRFRRKNGKYLEGHRVELPLAHSHGLLESELAGVFGSLLGRLQEGKEGRLELLPSHIELVLEAIILGHVGDTVGLTLEIEAGQDWKRGREGIERV